MPLPSRANIRQNLLHVGTQLCQDVSWSDYTQYKTDSQQLLQQQLLDFLYSESSWRFKILSKSNVSHDKNVLRPHPQDIVIIELANDMDYKMGVVTDTSECPRIRVRTLTNGKRDEPLIHSLNLGLLFRDPPSQSSSEVAAENEARRRAADGLEKTWQGQSANKISSERRKLVEFHENQITAGLHRG